MGFSLGRTKIVSRWAKPFVLSNRPAFSRGFSSELFVSSKYVVHISRLLIWCFPFLIFQDNRQGDLMRSVICLTKLLMDSLFWGSRLLPMKIEGAHEIGIKIQGCNIMAYVRTL
ncbi:hypothetical protein AMTRI_Chr08g163290 [Amborella trichopoda]